MITIYVKHQQSGLPLPGQLLSIEFCGDRIGWTTTEISSDDGSVNFNINSDQVILFVNGKRQLQGRVINGVTVFLPGYNQM